MPRRRPLTRLQSAETSIDCGAWLVQLSVPEKIAPEASCKEKREAVLTFHGAFPTTAAVMEAVLPVVLPGLGLITGLTTEPGVFPPLSLLPPPPPPQALSNESARVVIHAVVCLEGCLPAVSSLRAGNRCLECLLSASS